MIKPTDQQIHDEYKAGGISCRKLGLKYGVHMKTIRAAISRVEEARWNAERWDGALSRRTRNCLANAGITSKAQLLAYPLRTLIRLDNFGVKCLSEVERFVKNAKAD